MRRNSLAFRLVASAALWCALVLSGGGYLLSTLFCDTGERNFDAGLAVLLEGLVAGSEIGPEGALELRLQLGEPRFTQPLSGWYWQINQRERTLDRSTSLWDQHLPLILPGAGLAPEDEGVTSEIPGPLGQELRLLVRAISLPGAPEPLLYGVAGDRAEVSAEKRRFDRLLSLALGVLFLGLLGALLLQVRIALLPLRRIEAALAAIRAGTARRLEGRFPAELQPLALELNALLDHSEALIERARTHVGNLAHGLKTPLAVLTNEAARSEGALAALVSRQATQMRRLVDHHLARARAMATGSIIGARTEVAPLLDDLRRALLKIYAARALTIAIACPPELAFRGAREDLEEIVGNLLDNACKWARREVEVCAERQGERLRLVIEDDGPGLAPEQRAKVIERGRRLDERVPGSGLGLAIVADIVRLYGGRLALEQATLGGLRVSLDLPAAAGQEASRAA
jgi:signal transduction histidine kinase